MPEWSSGFPYFLQFQSEFGNKEFMIWATLSSQSCFCWLYRASPSLAAKNMMNLISVLTIWWCPCVESSLVLLEEGVCYDQCILLANSISLCLALFYTPWLATVWICPLGPRECLGSWMTPISYKKELGIQIGFVPRRALRVLLSFKVILER